MVFFKILLVFDFADYLENYGVNNLPVADETNEHCRFEIKFSFEPKNSASLTRVLDSMGLELKKEQLKINFFLLHKP